ncbi:MAG: cytochrome b5 domain-containing protein [Desulfurococcales archaeon]|nr:cytochrome b5 domain-containing protein [Desulfurococcales archaeon]
MIPRLLKTSRRAAWVAFAAAVLAYVTGYLLVSSFGGEAKFEPVKGLTVIVDYGLLRMFHYVVIPLLGLVAIVFHIAPYIYSKAMKLRLGNMSGRTVGNAAAAAFIVGGLLLAFKVAFIGMSLISPVVEPSAAPTSDTMPPGLQSSDSGGVQDGNVSESLKNNLNLVLTWDAVSSHNSGDSCWIVVNGKVYDVTSYINYHPAGAKSILQYCGKDATQAFAKYHSRRAWEILQHFYIGDIGGPIVSSPQLTYHAGDQLPSLPAQPLQDFEDDDYEDDYDYDYEDGEKSGMWAKDEYKEYEEED